MHEYAKKEIPNREYPVVEIKDLCPGDLIEDPFGNLLVYGSEAFYGKNGEVVSVNSKLEYKLVQKRKYARPLDSMFVYKDKDKQEIKSSYMSENAWFMTCAKLGKKPEIVEKRVMIPAFSNKVASFQKATDAFKFIDSQREPQLYALIYGNDRNYWVTRDFTTTEVKIPVDNCFSEVEKQLETKVENLKADLEARDQEIKFLKNHIDQLNTKHESEIESIRQLLKATKEKYEESLKTSKESFEKLRMTTLVIQNGRDDLLRERDENTQKIALLNRQIEKMISEKYKLNENIVCLSSAQETLRSELQKRVDHIEFLTKEIIKEQKESKKAREKLEELSVALEKC